MSSQKNEKRAYSNPKTKKIHQNTALKLILDDKISDKLNLNYYQKSDTDGNRNSDKNNTIRLNSTERYSARKHDSKTVQSGTLLFLKQTNPEQNQFGFTKKKKKGSNK